MKQPEDSSLGDISSITRGIRKKICYRTTWFVNAFTCGCSWSGHTWLMTLPGSATDLSKCHPRLLHTAQSKSHKLDSIQLLDFDQLRNSLSNWISIVQFSTGQNSESLRHNSENSAAGPEWEHDDRPVSALKCGIRLFICQAQLHERVRPHPSF